MAAIQPVQKVLIILPFLTRGGAETQAYNIAIGFKEKGYNVTIIAFEKKNGELIDKLHASNINWELLDYDLSSVHRRGMGKISSLVKLIFQIRKHKPDYLFPFTYYPNILISAIWRFTGAKKCFWNQRGYETIGFTLAEKIAVHQKPQYLSNATGSAEFISKRHNIGLTKVQVIHNGILPEEPKNSQAYWNAKIDRKPNELIFIQVANFYPEKNHAYLLRGWHQFVNRNKSNLNMRLLLVGYAPNNKCINEAKAIAFDYSLNNVEFWESTNDISGLLSIADVGVLTSSSEGCPNIVLEYMYAKLPVVLSRIKATEEILGTDYPLFCELSDEATLSEAFNKALDKSLTKKLIVYNYEKVIINYNVSKLQSKYVELVIS
jgi:glycosyltransferase involved in cell wall biosynthesis